ncbi:RILP-like protein homolog isoform X1 [Schistocerca americana]|uniref:RILP-like protein homolog isoform X1 n=1 Tax=Schistocerca americana TaxID=7009 RepID=UPI001F4FE4AA|nr:RILP-like protein homolog isoform X1 [Schistocerca americana]XP_047097714.1 RILP-like protein homolog isoform X1 [Schistocerca piceifrons]XP_049942064.1 RILP-like protein homolog isoform X3 [Schistocerca serialis cubense]
MPFQVEGDMEEYEQDLSVVDVYDIASEIGKEFEKIIDAYGTQAVTGLMPKVISALENLEALATKNERENTTVEELRARIAKLESDKLEKAEDRQRFEKELEQIEEHWREESQDLVSMVTRLQDENHKLSALLAERDDKLCGDSAHTVSTEVDVVVLQRLRNVIDQQREQIRSREREIQAKAAEIDALSAQVERLTMLGRELRRKHRGAQAQVHSLIDERADFLAQLQDQQRELVGLRQRLGLAQKENEDLAKSHSEVPDLTNKVVYDLDDPNRPRFTTAELKEILHERNELKAKVSDLEDELEIYRPKSRDFFSSPRWSTEQRSSFCDLNTKSPVAVVRPHFPSPPPVSESYSTLEKETFNSAGKDSNSSAFQSPSEEEEEPPVQGPLPFEPDDAPWKKSESGIRKFFRKLLSDNNGSFLGAAPKRSLSSLSKMALSSTSDSNIPL